MNYQAGAERLQFRCIKCGLISPHEGKCFRCGSQKQRERVPEIVKMRNKGQSISVRAGS